MMDWHYASFQSPITEPSNTAKNIKLETTFPRPLCSQGSG